MSNEHFKDGYKLLRTTTFNNDLGFALGYDPEVGLPFGVWLFAEENNKKAYIYGDYFIRDQTEIAKLNFDGKVRKYLSDNPGVAIKKVTAVSL